jgi:hypothetical protein
MGGGRWRAPDPRDGGASRRRAGRRPLPRGGPRRDGPPGRPRRTGAAGGVRGCRVRRARASRRCSRNRSSPSRPGLKARTAPDRALASGGSQLEMLAQTTVQDTGRAAVSAGMIARPHIDGYVRVLTLPSCSRCAILAGRVYRWSTGFQRHPRCDCRMLPQTVAAPTGPAVDPDEALRSGQIRGLSKAEEAAISDGADLNQIVNAHRSGAYQGMTTAEGVTRRGVAGKRLRGRQRLTVGAIQRLASDRAEMTALLRFDPRVPDLTPTGSHLLPPARCGPGNHSETENPPMSEQDTTTTPDDAATAPEDTTQEAARSPGDGPRRPGRPEDPQGRQGRRPRRPREGTATAGPREASSRTSRTATSPNSRRRRSRRPRPPSSSRNSSGSPCGSGSPSRPASPPTHPPPPRLHRGRAREGRRRTGEAPHPQGATARPLAGLTGRPARPARHERPAPASGRDQVAPKRSPAKGGLTEGNPLGIHNLTSRTDAAALIPEEVSNVMLGKATEQSAVLQHVPRIPSAARRSGSRSCRRCPSRTGSTATPV